MSEFIPGTNPDWDRKLPDGDLNSLVDANGENYDNGFNFDEKDDDVPEFNLDEAQKRIDEARNFEDSGTGDEAGA